jgi:hypothetical protein
MYLVGGRYNFLLVLNMLKGVAVLYGFIYTIYNVFMFTFRSVRIQGFQICQSHVDLF